MLSPLLINVFFAAVVHIIVVRYRRGKGITANLNQFEGDGEDRETERIACFRKVVWGVLYADDADVVTN